MEISDALKNHLSFNLEDLCNLYPIEEKLFRRLKQKQQLFGRLNQKQQLRSVSIHSCNVIVVKIYILNYPKLIRKPPTKRVKYYMTNKLSKKDINSISEYYDGTPSEFIVESLMSSHVVDYCHVYVLGGA